MERRTKGDDDDALHFALARSFLHLIICAVQALKKGSGINYGKIGDDLFYICSCFVFDPKGIFKNGKGRM